MGVTDRLNAAIRAGLALVLMGTPAGARAETVADPLSSPVLVELYTSQGCAHCPPADEVLSTWGREAFERGEIVPLAFHVDYWDRHGWKDPYGSHAYTNRQYAYGRRFKLRYAYTPQLIVAGRAEFNGANRARAEQAVERFRDETPLAAMSLKPAWKNGRLAVSVRAERASGSPAEGEELRVMLAVYETGLVTAVRAGENAGRTIRNDFVVRMLKDLGGLESGREFSAEVPWEKSWRKDRAGAAVFLQDSQSMAVRGVRNLYPLE